MKCRTLTFQNLGLNVGLLDLKSEHLLLDCIVPPLLSVLVLQLFLQMYLN